MKLRMRIVPKNIDKTLAAQAKVTPLLLSVLIREVIERGRTNISMRTPVGHTSALRGGYTTEMRGHGTHHPVGVLGNPQLYHDVREEGRKPGKMPPVEPLIPWVGSKLGIPPGPERVSVAWLIARKIGAHGYKGAHMLEEGWEETRKEINPRLNQLGLKIVGTVKS